MPQLCQWRFVPQLFSLHWEGDPCAQTLVQLLDADGNFTCVTSTHAVGRNQMSNRYVEFTINMPLNVYHLEQWMDLGFEKKLGLPSGHCLLRKPF